MKLTRHNGRAGKNGTYNPKHNDRNFNIHNSEHIDVIQAERNIYWDCYNGYRNLIHDNKSDELAYSFEKVEQYFYASQYQNFVNNQNARNEKNRHPERNRTTNDLLKSKKTCPEESIFQVGKECEYAAKRLDGVITKITNAMKSTIQKIHATLMKPEVKKEGIEQIKKKARSSILEKLNRNKAEIAERDAMKNKMPIRKQEMDL